MRIFRRLNGLQAWVTALAMIGSAHALRAAPIVGQVDNFQDNTTGSWGGGDTLTTQTGGPQGSSDIYMQMVSSGGGGSGGALAAYNFDTTRWGGDYQSAGVGALSVDLLAPASNTRSPLQIRIVLFSSSTGSSFTSVTPFLLNNDGAWHHAFFPLASAGMTQVSGSETYASTISNVGRLMIRYDQTPTKGGTVYAGTLGVDNVTAVPEPSGLVLLSAAGFALLTRRRASRV